MFAQHALIAMLALHFGCRRPSKRTSPCLDAAVAVEVPDGCDWPHRVELDLQGQARAEMVSLLWAVNRARRPAAPAVVPGTGTEWPASSALRLVMVAPSGPRRQSWRPGWRHPRPD